MKDVIWAQADMKFGLKNYSNPMSQPPQTLSQGYLGCHIFSFYIYILLVKADQPCLPFCISQRWIMTESKGKEEITTSSLSNWSNTAPSETKHWKIMSWTQKKICIMENKHTFGAETRGSLTLPILYGQKNRKGQCDSGFLRLLKPRAFSSFKGGY